MAKRTWNSGPPPHIGWWNASTCRGYDAWRWWNGEHWSLVCFPEDYLHIVVECADTATHPLDNANVKWTTYYPRNARVPRINPATQQDRESKP